MAELSETLEERRDRYLANAADADYMARRVTDALVRSHYAQLAKSWRDMATEADAALKRTDSPNSMAHQ